MLGYRTAGLDAIGTTAKVEISGFGRVSQKAAPPCRPDGVGMSLGQSFGVHDFVPTLQKLTVYDSSLLDIHTQDFSACTAMTQLELWNTRLVKANGQHYMDHALSLFPANIGLLTQLHTLCVNTGGSGAKANVEWISQLMSLQDIKMSFGIRHRM